MTWTCAECGSVSEWTTSHRWFGSWKDHDTGQTLRVVCSAKCRAASEAKGYVADPGVKN